MADINDDSTPWYGKTVDTDNIIKQMLPQTDFLKTEFLNKSYDTDTFFKHMLIGIINKPLWVKQAIYVELRDDIKKMSNVELLEALDKNDLLQLYIPALSHLGEKIISDKAYAQKLNLSYDLQYYLAKIDGIKNVIDLCYENNWTLKYFSQLTIQAEEMGFISEIRSNQIINLFQFIADRIDIGTLLVRLNKITPEQITFANFSLSEANKTFDDDKITLESVIVKLGYLSQDRINSLLLLKKASEIVFCADPEEVSEEMEILQENISIMAEELKNFRPLLEAKDRKIKQLEQEVQMYKEELQKLQENPNLMNVFKKL